MKILKRLPKPDYRLVFVAIHEKYGDLVSKECKYDDEGVLRVRNGYRWELIDGSTPFEKFKGNVYYILQDT